MKAHDQKAFWRDTGVYSQEISSFAKKSYSRIKKEGKAFLLELGCGIGSDAVFFAGNGLEVLALDFSKPAIDYLNKIKDEQNLYNLDCRVKDFTKPWQSEVYDPESVEAVYAHRSLHYFDEKTTKRVFANVHNILAPNGLFFVAVHSALHTEAETGRMLEKGLYLYKGKQRRFFSMPCIKRYMNGSFDIISLGYNDKDTKSFLEVVARKI